MNSTRTLLVPLALVAMGTSAAFLSGCRKEKEAPVAPSAPHVETVEERMADPEYVKQLDAQRDEMKRLAGQLNAATNEAQRKAAAQLLEVNRLKTMEVIRNRMATGGNKISK